MLTPFSSAYFILGYMLCMTREYGNFSSGEFQKCRKSLLPAGSLSVALPTELAVFLFVKNTGADSESTSN